jgi:hypothetical protein
MMDDVFIMFWVPQSLWEIPHFQHNFVRHSSGEGNIFVLRRKNVTFYNAAH